MATSDFYLFEQWPEDIAHGVHDYSSDTLKIALVAAANAPDVAADAVLADLTTIALTNLDSDALTISSSGQSSGTYKLVIQDKVILANGGDLPAFRYVIVYNDSPTSPADPLIGYYDYGEDLVLEDGEQITVDMVEANGALQIAV